MCRLTVYKGKSRLIGDLIVKPENSLMHQSRDAAYHPGVVDTIGKRNIRVNGDGFGVAWYSYCPITGPTPHCFKFITPAWSCANLRSLGAACCSPLIFGHIRAASSGIAGMDASANGGGSSRDIVNEENCHPFQFGQYLFMHNGGIPNFAKVKRVLCNLLDEECFLSLVGSTDSEHIFALFLSLLPDKNQMHVPVDVLIDTLERTIATLLKVMELCGLSDSCCSLNIVLSDGVHVLATRYRSGSKGAAPSLYYNWGANFSCDRGHFCSEPGTDHANEVVISSEPLSREGRVSVDYDCSESCSPPAEQGHWVLIPNNHLLVCVGSPSSPEELSDVYLTTLEPDAEEYGSDLVEIPWDVSHSQAVLSQLCANSYSGSDSASESKRRSSEHDEDSRLLKLDLPVVLRPSQTNVASDGSYYRQARLQSRAVGSPRKHSKKLPLGRSYSDGDLQASSERPAAGQHRHHRARSVSLLAPFAGLLLALLVQSLPVASSTRCWN